LRSFPAFGIDQCIDCRNDIVEAYEPFAQALGLRIFFDCQLFYRTAPLVSRFRAAEIAAIVAPHSEDEAHLPLLPGGQELLIVEEGHRRVVDRIGQQVELPVFLDLQIPGTLTEPFPVGKYEPVRGCQAAAAHYAFEPIKAVFGRGRTPPGRHLCGIRRFAGERITGGGGEMDLLLLTQVGIEEVMDPHPCISL
jgi:hypothetical protein